MKLVASEFIQRSERGGAPLDNDSAHALGVNHGTSLVLLSKRKFVSLLKASREAALSGESDLEFAGAVQEVLDEHDQFVFPVSSDEWKVDP